jgi:hypothetical protein
MLNVVIEDRKKWQDTDEPVDNTFDQALEWLHENPDFNDPIMFPWSTNATTYIWTTDNGIQVSTCNNHNWGNYIQYDYTGDWCDINGDMEFFNLNALYKTTRAQYRKDRYNINS